uniref:uncharacterized protein LOC122598620 n=1 Tax=Erigeron canadensis TaxID=72917 RepID=UPI001CB9B6F6|nr:uncharacterized protein LOC122598620 [Erigeron canadensis]
MARIEEQQIFQDLGHISGNKGQSTRQFQWVFGEVKNDITNEYQSDFVEECSSDLCKSLGSSSSEEVDDAISSSLGWSSHNSPLYELSELMAQLPIKRGLSKYYQGKSESFGSLSNLTNIKDLAKKGNHRSRRSTKLLGQSQTLSAKRTIVKNKKSCLSSIARTSLFSSLGEMGALLDTISVQTHNF